MQATRERPRVNLMPQLMFIGTDQEYDRYRKKRKYSPIKIRVIEEVLEEDLAIDREEREETIQLMREMQEEAAANGVTPENLPKVLNEILDDKN